MVEFIAVLMQTATVGVPEIAFDLAQPQPPRPCEAARAGEIVVCGRSDTARYRLQPVPDRSPEGLPKAEVAIIGELKGAVETEAAVLGSGVISNRLMLRLKLPF